MVINYLCADPKPSSCSKPENILSRVKQKREQEISKIIELNKATVDFLDALQYFSTRETQAEYKSEVAEGEMKLRRAYFQWEMTIEAYCRQKDKDVLAGFSKKILGSPYTLNEYHPDLTNEILDFSKKMRKRL